MSNLTVSQNNQIQPKKNYVKKGAAIGATTQVGLTALGIGITLKSFGKDEFVKSVKLAHGSMGKYAAVLAATTALCAGIGAGIGKIVEHCKKEPMVGTYQDRK